MTASPLNALDDYERRLEELAVGCEEQAFELYYRHADVDLGVWEKKIREVLLEPGLAAACDAAGGDGARRAEILRDWATDARALTDEIIALKNDVQKTVIETKPALDGEEIPRHRKTDILIKDGDRDKRWRAYAAEGKLRAALATKGRELYVLRNEAARALGFADYPALALSLEELTVEELLAAFDRYERETRAAYEELIAEGVDRFTLGRLEPWDAYYIAEQLCAAPDRYFPKEKGLPALAATVKAFGRDLDAMALAIHADADIPYGGLCFAVRIPDDIRILVNLKEGMADYRVLYHEFGHAVHRKHVTVKSYSLKAGDAGFFSEGMADVWGLWVDRPAWLAAYTDMDKQEIARVARAADRSFAARVRRFMAHQVFEIAAYRGATGDLGAVLNDAARRYLGYEYDDDYWQEIYFPYLYPMYYKNYTLARVIQRAIHGRLEREFGEPLGKPAVFDFLVDNFYAEGATRDWKAKLAAVDIRI